MDFTGQPISPSFKGQEIQKREKSTIEVNRNNLLVLGFCPLSNIFKKYDVSEDGSVSIFRQKSIEPGVPLRLHYSQSLGTTETISC